MNILMHNDLTRLVQAAQMAENHHVVIHPSMRNTLAMIASGKL